MRRPSGGGCRFVFGILWDRGRSACGIPFRLEGFGSFALAFALAQDDRVEDRAAVEAGEVPTQFLIFHRERARLSASSRGFPFLLSPHQERFARRHHGQCNMVGQAESTYKILGFYCLTRVNQPGTLS